MAYTHEDSVFVPEVNGPLAALKVHIFAVLGGITPPQGGSVSPACNVGAALDHDGASIKNLSHAPPYYVISCLQL